MTNETEEFEFRVDMFYALCETRRTNRVARLLYDAYNDIEAYVCAHPNFMGDLPPRPPPDVHEYY